MNIDETQNYLIDQFCIYHYKDIENDIFRSYITYERKFDVNGKTTNCYKLPSRLGKWEIYGKFYAISSFFRPIPHGLKLLNTEVEYEKDGILNLEHMYDPFNITDVNLSLITWTSRVPETVPLYLHKTPDKFTYVSFEENPPVKNSQGWGNEDLSPVYVLVDNSYYRSYKNSPYKIYQFPKDKNNFPKFKFQESNNRCIPTRNKNGITLERCVLLTDENIYDIESFYAISLRERMNYLIKQDNKSQINKIFSNTPFSVIITAILIFIISIVILVIIIYK